MQVEGRLIHTRNSSYYLGGSPTPKVEQCILELSGRPTIDWENPLAGIPLRLPCSPTARQGTTYGAAVPSDVSITRSPYSHSTCLKVDSSASRLPDMETRPPESLHGQAHEDMIKYSIDVSSSCGQHNFGGDQLEAEALSGISSNFLLTSDPTIDEPTAISTHCTVITSSASIVENTGSILPANRVDVRSLPRPCATLTLQQEKIAGSALPQSSPNRPSPATVFEPTLPTVSLQNLLDSLKEVGHKYLMVKSDGEEDALGSVSANSSPFVGQITTSSCSINEQPETNGSRSHPETDGIDAAHMALCRSPSHTLDRQEDASVKSDFKEDDGSISANFRDNYISRKTFTGLSDGQATRATAPAYDQEVETTSCPTVAESIHGTELTNSQCACSSSTPRVETVLATSDMDSDEVQRHEVESIATLPHAGPALNHRASPLITVDDSDAQVIQKVGVGIDSSLLHADSCHSPRAKLIVAAGCADVDAAQEESTQIIAHGLPLLADAEAGGNAIDNRNDTVDRHAQTLPVSSPKESAMDRATDLDGLEKNRTDASREVEHQGLPKEIPPIPGILETSSRHGPVEDDASTGSSFAPVDSSPIVNLRPEDAVDEAQYLQLNCGSQVPSRGPALLKSPGVAPTVALVVTSEHDACGAPDPHSSLRPSTPTSRAFDIFSSNRHPEPPLAMPSLRQALKKLSYMGAGDLFQTFTRTPPARCLSTLGPVGAPRLLSARDDGVYFAPSSSLVAQQLAGHDLTRVDNAQSSIQTCSTGLPSANASMGLNSDEHGYIQPSCSTVETPIPHNSLARCGDAGPAKDAYDDEKSPSPSLPAVKSTPTACSPVHSPNSTSACATALLTASGMPEERSNAQDAETSTTAKDINVCEPYSNTTTAVRHHISSAPETVSMEQRCLALSFAQEEAEVLVDKDVGMAPISKENMNLSAQTTTDTLIGTDLNMSTQTPTHATVADRQSMVSVAESADKPVNRLSNSVSDLEIPEKGLQTASTIPSSTTTEN